MCFLQSPEIIFFSPFFHIVSLDIFRVSILWKCIGARCMYLVSAAPPTVLG